ncbi:MAG: agmatine deiminase family protein [Deltaproteobacteria bacterium]|nr:MAG: agmatine deiminase family protein [Deltaproteobacteria bacterium]
MSAPRETPGRWRMPAEWMPHEATLLTWPHDAGIWGRLMPDIQGTFARLAALLAEVEDVHIAAPAAWHGRVDEALRGAGADAARVTLHPVDSDDVWARDHGPIAVVPLGVPAPGQPPRLLLDWRFNAWGAKFPHERDDRVAAAMAERLGLPCRRMEMVLEGGAIEVNGEGDLITTRAVLLNANRGGSGDPAQAEETLREALGVERVIWLDEGLEGDDTDGHVDDIARFVDPCTVVLVQPADAAHPDHATMRRNRAILEASRGPGGRPFTLVDLPAPDPVAVDGQMLPASYANFAIANGRVIVPTFAQPADDRALGILRECFPGRDVVGLDARALITQSGAVHCVTQQLPAEGAR